MATRPRPLEADWLEDRRGPARAAYLLMDFLGTMFPPGGDYSAAARVSRFLTLADTVRAGGTSRLTRARLRWHRERTEWPTTAGCDLPHALFRYIAAVHVREVTIRQHSAAAATSRTPP